MCDQKSLHTGQRTVLFRVFHSFFSPQDIFFKSGYACYMNVWDLTDFLYMASEYCVKSLGNNFLFILTKTLRNSKNKRYINIFNTLKHFSISCLREHVPLQFIRQTFGFKLCTLRKCNILHGKIAVFCLQGCFVNTKSFDFFFIILVISIF